MAYFKLRYRCADLEQRQSFIREVVGSSWSFSYDRETFIVTILYHQYSLSEDPVKYIKWSILDQYNLDKVEFIKSTKVKKTSTRF